MSQRPYILISVAMSIDGYIDDSTPERLRLSNPEDFDRVDEVRATCDAILIGANTVRRDNPSLLVKSEQRRAERQRRGLPPYPVKVTITASGDLDPASRFFHTGGDKLVYAPTSAYSKTGDRLNGLATVVEAGEPLSLPAVLDDLGNRDIKKIMIEGGGTIHNQLLVADLVDEIHLAIAPFFIGDPTAPRFVHPGHFPQNPHRRMHLAETRQIGDISFARYLTLRIP